MQAGWPEGEAIALALTVTVETPTAFSRKLGCCCVIVTWTALEVLAKGPLVGAPIATVVITLPTVPAVKPLVVASAWAAATSSEELPDDSSRAAAKAAASAAVCISRLRFSKYPMSITSPENPMMLVINRATRTIDWPDRPGRRNLILLAKDIVMRLGGECAAGRKAPRIAAVLRP